MAKSIDGLISFTAGELTPKMDARVDQPKYRHGMRQCQNLIPYKQGGLTRRPGFQYIANAKAISGLTAGQSAAVNLLEFKFSPATTFIIEVGHQYMRFYSNGTQVMQSTASLWTTATTYGSGNFVQDPSDLLVYFCLLPFQQSFFSAVRPGLDPTHWVQQNIYEVTTPYNAVVTAPDVIFTADIWGLTDCEINDVIYLVHPDYPTNSLTRLGDTNWTMQPTVFLSPALLDQNATDTTIAATGTIGTVTLSATAPAWVTGTFYSVGNSVLQGGVIYNCLVAHLAGTFSSDLGIGKWVAVTMFQPGHIGSTWQLAYLRASAYLEVDGTPAGGFTDGTSATIQALGAWEVHTYGVWSSDIAVQRSLDGGMTWDTVRTVTGRSDRNVDITGVALFLGTYRIVIANSSALVGPGATNPRVVFECVDSFLYGMVQITGYTNPYSCTASVVAQLANTGPTEYWSEAAWSAVRGYPQAVCPFQQRIIYASSGYEPQRIWGSVTNDLQNFALGDQTLATDAFAFDLNAPGRGPIEWLLAQQDLFAGFAGAEWIINSGSTNSNGSSTGGALTPSNVNAVEQSAWGSSPGVKPLNVGDAIVFTQRQATSLRQMLFSVYTAKYMSQDLTEMSDHLFVSGIVQSAYQSRWHRQSIIWVATQQGTLLGLTYELDSEVAGWHRHQTGYGTVDDAGAAIANDNGFETVASIFGKSQGDDEVWVVTNRIISGVPTRLIERMNPNNWEKTFTAAPNQPFASLSDAFYVDAGRTVLNPGTTTIPGMGYLNGRYVVGLADGSAFGPVLVSGGTAQLPPAIPSTVATVQIGLAVPYAGQPMRLDADARVGSTQGLKKQISDLYLRVWNSLGGQVSNGTVLIPLWVYKNVYQPGDRATSPLTMGVFQWVTTGFAFSLFDPSVDPANWVATYTPTYNQPIPIPYPTTGGQFGYPVMITVPTDLRVQPHKNPSPDHDPIIIIQGSDALPLTVLACVIKYDVISEP